MVWNILGKNIWQHSVFRLHFKKCILEFVLCLLRRIPALCSKFDGVVKTSIYCVLCWGDSQHITGIAETRPDTLLLEVSQISGT